MKIDLESIKTNTIAVLVTGIIGLLISYSAEFDGAGMATLFLVNLPILITFFTLALYFLSKLTFKKKNWIISLLGMLFILTIAISFHFTDFNQ